MRLGVEKLPAWGFLRLIEITWLRLGVQRNHRLRLGVEKSPVTNEPVEFEK